MSQSWSESNADAVLASIKRLVAQSSARPEASPAKSDGPAKLVLTPAQRVSVSVDDAPLENDEVATSATAPDSVWSLEDRIAELEQAVGAQEDSWEPDGSEGPEQETPRKFVFQHRRPVETLEQVAAAEPADISVDAPERDNIVEISAAQQPTLAPEPTAEAQTVVEPPEPVKALQDAPDAGASDAAPVETATSSTAAVPEMPPEAFRALVAEIVREELQGQLGERITRNVRKLVRQEIHRALIARDLENGG